MIPLRAATRPPAIDIVRALTDKQLLGAALGDPAPWRTWFAVLRAAYALPLSDDERVIFRTVAGDRAPPLRRVKELWDVAGRRSGKSRTSAMIATYEACFHQHKLAAGEQPMVLVLAASMQQAQVVFGYIEGFLRESPVLSREIESVTQSEIRLRNGVTIAVHNNSYRSTRGRTLLAAVFDECAFWYDEGANTDIEIARAIMPSLATTNGLLVGISSPYRRTGLLHQKYANHFGKDGDTLVVSGETRLFNPLIGADVVEQALADDPEAARSEWMAEWRADITSYLDPETIEAAVDADRPLEIPPRSGTRYWAFCDPSGGRNDSFTIAVGHRSSHAKDALFIIDAARAIRPPFEPRSVVAEFAKLLKSYGLSRVVGDKYAGEWVSESFREHHIRYETSEKSKSEIYVEAVSLWSRCAIRVPDHPALLKELRGLERRTRRGGCDVVDHARNGHDDLANVVAGVAVLALRGGYDSSMRWVSGPDDGDTPEEAEERRQRAWQAARLAAHIRQHAGGPRW